jgi:tRNA A37 methylthiotransferase MiaB
VPALLERFKRNGGFGLVGLIGVQSNQYPRALDLARQFRADGVPVIIGGFHVSGCLSMLDGRAVELDQCRELGVSMFAGEAEADSTPSCAMPRKTGSCRSTISWTICRGSKARQCRSLPKRYVERTLGLCTSFDAGRGCPYQCSFCTIINVQGRKSRFRSCDDIEHLVRLNWAQVSTSSSSPTTISPATRTGRRFSTA